MSRTMQQLAQEALDVQDACNLSGVVHGFTRAIADLKALLPDACTEAINAHPICALWSDKIAHLTHTQHGNGLSVAYREVNRLAKGKEKVC